jgi:N-acylneuraminate cytidylyltransferase
LSRQARVVAFIPARGGSKRVPKKNVLPLAGHPLIAYTIASARASGIFDAVVVSTEDPTTAEIATHYGAEVPFLRPLRLAEDLSPDIEWLHHMLGGLAASGRSWQAFSILRPTSPFRLPETIQRAWAAFASRDDADSLRAVEKCRQHPGKMWVIEGNLMRPLLPGEIDGRPWHSSPYQALPPVFEQNASLEIAWTRVPEESNSISGERIVPFLTE